MSNPFEILGLGSDASADEVKARWRELCKVHHPDRGGNAVDFNTYRLAYNQAFKIASEPKKCERCHGTRSVLIGAGFGAMKVVCPDCKGSGAR